MKAAVVVLFVSVLLAACAETVANMCPGTSAPRCLTGTVCQNDPARGCQTCRCDTPYYVPDNQPPQGAPQPVQ